jgi:hypothetical protein
LLAIEVLNFSGAELGILVLESNLAGLIGAYLFLLLTRWKKDGVERVSLKWVLVVNISVTLIAPIYVRCITSLFLFS